MKNKITFILFFSFFHFLVFSQELPTIIPPSPEASSLSKYVDIPVSHYTGLPNITIPIYTIEQKGISVPVFLSYHARGVLVSEMAPRTGMGWSLLYGGSISRQVRGKADDVGWFHYLSNSEEFENYSTSITAREAVENREQLDPAYDFYPDQFTFNAGEISGNFILDYTNGQPLIQSYGDVKISYTRGDGGKIDTFIITDSKGIKYYFGKSKDGQRFAQDYQTSSGMSIYTDRVVPDLASNTSIDEYYSSWKLMDIETTYGEVISFYYGISTGNYYFRKAYDKHETPPEGVINSAAYMSDITKIHTRLSQVWSYEKPLIKITFNQGRDSIKFIESSTIREDFNGYALDKISIHNSNNLIKSFKLNYSYTTSTDHSNLLWYFDNSMFEKNFKRMFLNSIEEEGRNGQKLPPYTFTYDETVLPSVFSSRQDYWGYYNGAPNNGPYTRMFTYGIYESDRRVDTLKSQAGILKEIKYPTGGSTKFTYEHNRGRIPVNFKKLKIPKINPGSTNNMVELMFTKEDFTYNSTIGSYELPNLTFPDTKVKYNIFCLHFRDINDTITPDCVFEFSMNSYPMEIGSDISFYADSEKTYALKATPIFPRSKDKDFTITITYDVYDNPDFIFAAGKRIKKIEHVNENGITIVKEYEYVSTLDEDLSLNVAPSGAIIGLPSYLNTSDGYAPYFISTITHYYDSSSSSYGSFQPNSIGYSGVTEYQGTKVDNTGKTEYAFSNISDSGGDYYEFPYHPPTDNEWLRGKNIRTKYYKNNGIGGYNLVKEIYNKYLHGNNIYDADFEYPGFLNPDFIFTPESTKHDIAENAPWDYIHDRTHYKLPLFMRQEYPIGDPTIGIDFVPGYRIYHLTGGTLDLSSTTVKEYFDNGTLEKKTTYSYDYDKHYQLKNSKSVNSKNNELLTTFYYPTDYLLHVSPDAASGANDLLRNNRFEVLQTDVSENQNVLSSIRTNYYWINNLTLPKTIETVKGPMSASNPLQERIVYHNYDSLGNPIEVSQAEGTHIYYIWGYNQTQPIAKIENFDSTQAGSIAGLISAAVTASNADNDRTIGNTGKEGALRTALKAIQDSSVLANSQMTYFTYDPLIGVTSITDPKGDTQYYIYDDFNRLQFVKDKDGKILNEYQYHYRSQ